MEAALSPPEKPRLRVLLFSQYFWPEAFRINQVAEDLVSAGADVTVLTGQPNYPEGRTFSGYSAWRVGREWHPSGFEIIRVPLVPRGKAGACGLALNYLSFLITGAILGAWMLRGRKFDVLFNYCISPALQGFVGVWLRLFTGGKLVIWVQDLWPQALAGTGFVKSPIVLGAIEKLMKALYRSADLLLAQSQAFVRAIEPMAGNTPVRFFPNPGERAIAGKTSLAPTLPTKFNVVFAGNIGKAQAMETVVAAADMLRDDPEIHLSLFGSGSQADWVAVKVRELGLSNLSLPGRLPPEAMPGVYAQANALLLTLVDHDLLAQTVPSRLQSYLAAGVPIVAAVEGEAADLVKESGAGLACQPQDPGALADTIRAIKTLEPQTRSAMGNAARTFFSENYEPDRLARELFEMLSRLSVPGLSLARPREEMPKPN